MSRTAWKTARSCSPDSDSMWADSLASQADAGMHVLAGVLQHARDRVLGEPVDLQVRAQHAGARWAMARSRRAWPRPMGDDR